MGEIIFIEHLFIAEQVFAASVRTVKTLHRPLHENAFERCGPGQADRPVVLNIAQRQCGSPRQVRVDHIGMGVWELAEFDHLDKVA